MQMKTIHAIFTNGVFRPTEPVAFPEQCEVEFEPRIVNQAGSETDDMEDIYALLSRRFESGQHNVAERHNEHQP